MGLGEGRNKGEAKGSKDTQRDDAYFMNRHKHAHYTEHGLVPTYDRTSGNCVSDQHRARQWLSFRNTGSFASHSSRLPPHLVRARERSRLAAHRALASAYMYVRHGFATTSPHLGPGVESPHSLGDRACAQMIYDARRQKWRGQL